MTKNQYHDVFDNKKKICQFVDKKYFAIYLIQNGQYEDDEDSLPKYTKMTLFS